MVEVGLVSYHRSRSGGALKPGERQDVRAMNVNSLDEAPAELLNSGSECGGVTITAKHPEPTGWTRPGTFYFRRAAPAWETIGVER